MPSQTRLDGCSRRYAHQIERLGEFLAVAQPSILTATSSRVPAEVLLDAVVVLTVSYLDAYLNCLVGLGTAHQEPVVREYLKRYGSPQERNLADSCNLGQLMHFARTRISFANKGRKLEQIFDLLFGFSPWPDNNAGSLIRDLVRVRNIIVHAGGWPNAAHANDAETTGLIVESHKISYRLSVAPFIREMLTAAGMLSVYVQEKLAVHPKFGLRQVRR